VSDLHPLDKADLTRIERLARESIQQVEHLRRNGPGDEIRFGFIFDRADMMSRYARRGFRRYERARGERQET
jgi:hypothetical protein